VKMSRLYPKSNSPLFFKNHPLWIAENVVSVLGEGDAAQVRWIKEIASARPRFTLIDIGAHVGTFSRQMLIALPNLERVFAYEPDAQNFDGLRSNLMPWQNRLELMNYGLSDVEGPMPFFRDQWNQGNYSLARSAMRRSDFKRGKATMRLVGGEAERWIDDGATPIFYKSDTQGYDELIATLVPPQVWDHVFAAVFEIWHIAKPSFDLRLFRAILDRFSHLKFLQRDEMVTADQAMEFLIGTDETWDDLAAWTD
jgi:FkbM family methyltransferase